MIYKLHSIISSSVIFGIWTNIFFHISRINNTNNNNNNSNYNYKYQEQNEIDTYIQNFGGYVR